MASSLFSMALRVARKVTSVRDGVATGGSTTTATVANNPETLTADALIGGTFFLRSGANTDEEARHITDNDATTFTWTTAMAGAVASGDTYAYCDKDCPLDILIAGINEAVRRVNPSLSEDTSLTVVSTQSKYTLPTAARHIVKVEVATKTSAPYNYQQYNHWTEKDGELRFDPDYYPTSTGKIIRLTYPTAHTTLTIASKLPEYIDEEAVYWRAVLEVLDPLLDIYPDKQRLKDVFQEAQIEWQRRVPNMPKRTPRIATW